MSPRKHHSLVAIVLIAAAATACNNKKKVPEPTNTPAVNTDPIWRLAPGDTTFGLVLSARAHEQLPVLLREALDLSRLTAPGTAALAALGRRSAQTIGMDVFTRDLWAQTGLVASEPAGFFATSSGAYLLVVPVANSADFLDRMNGKTERRKGRTVDIIAGGKLFCATVDARYLCATDSDLLSVEALGGGEIREHVARLPGSLRGHVEMVGFLDKGASPLPLANGSKSFVLALEFANGRADLHGWLEWFPPPDLLDSLALGDPPAELRAQNENSLLRVQIPARLRSPSTAQTLERLVGPELIDSMRGQWLVLEGDKASLSEAIADTDETVGHPGMREMLAGRANAVVWERIPDPFSVMSGGSDSRPLLTGGWLPLPLLAALYDVAATVTLDKSGWHLRIAATTMAADSEELYRRYKAVIADAATGGDRRRLRALADEFPKSLAARKAQSAERGGSAVESYLTLLVELGPRWLNMLDADNSGASSVVPDPPPQLP